MRPSLRVGGAELNRAAFLATGRALMSLRNCGELQMGRE